MKVGDGACEPVQEAGAVVPEFLGDLTADEGNGEAAAGAGLREGMEPDGVRGKVQAEDFGHAWDGGGAKLEEGHGACGGLDVGGDGADGGVWGGEVTDMGEEANGVSMGGEVTEANRRVAYHVDHLKVDACDWEELVLPTVGRRSIAYNDGIAWLEGRVGAAGIGGEGMAGGALVVELA